MMGIIKRLLVAVVMAVPLLLAGQQSAQAVNISHQFREWGCFGIGCEAEAMMTVAWRVQADGQGVRFDSAALNATNDCDNFEPDPSLDVTHVWIENANGATIWTGANKDVGEPDCVEYWLHSDTDDQFVTVNTNTATFRITFKARVNNGDDDTTTMTIQISD